MIKVAIRIKWVFVGLTFIASTFAHARPNCSPGIDQSAQSIQQLREVIKNKYFDSRELELLDCIQRALESDVARVPDGAPCDRCAGELNGLYLDAASRAQAIGVQHAGKWEVNISAHEKRLSLLMNHPTAFEQCTDNTRCDLLRTALFNLGNAHERMAKHYRDRNRPSPRSEALVYPDGAKQRPCGKVWCAGVSLRANNP